MKKNNKDDDDDGFLMSSKSEVISLTKHEPLVKPQSQSQQPLPQTSVNKVVQPPIT